MTIKTFVLFYYLSTFSMNGGMATASAEFASLGECERAAKAIKEHFGGLATNVRYVCVEKTTIPVAR